MSIYFVHFYENSIVSSKNMIEDLLFIHRHLAYAFPLSKLLIDRNDIRHNKRFSLEDDRSMKWLMFWSNETKRFLERSSRVKGQRIHRWDMYSDIDRELYNLNNKGEADEKQKLKLKKSRFVYQWRIWSIFWVSSSMMSLTTGITEGFVGYGAAFYCHLFYLKNIYSFWK